MTSERTRRFYGCGWSEVVSAGEGSNLCHLQKKVWDVTVLLTTTAIGGGNSQELAQRDARYRQVKPPSGFTEKLMDHILLQSGAHFGSRFKLNIGGAWQFFDISSFSGRNLCKFLFFNELN